MFRPLAVGLAILLALAAPATAADGQKIFQLQCRTCHLAKSSLSGPSLIGVSKRSIAALPDYAFSEGLKSKGGTWTDENLDAFMAAPKKFAPGTRMPGAWPVAADRAALIAYMKTLN
jgi:cytochrome c